MMAENVVSEGSRISFAGLFFSPTLPKISATASSSQKTVHARRPEILFTISCFVTSSLTHCGGDRKSLHWLQYGTSAINTEGG